MTKPVEVFKPANVPFLTLYAKLIFRQVLIKTEVKALYLRLRYFTGWSLREFVKLTNLEFSPQHLRHRAGESWAMKL